MDPTDTYELLRNLTCPVVAITCRRGDKLNGMISDNAIRASIVPDIPRVAAFIHKFNYSHDMIFETGRFNLHILHAGQFDVIHTLGFFSGRDRDKLTGIPHHLGAGGCPVLEDCYASFECELINVMDTGSSTCFLGEATAVHRGPGAEVMTSAYMRAHMPPEWGEPYVAHLAEAQAEARAASRNIRAVIWRDLRPR